MDDRPFGVGGEPQTGDAPASPRRWRFTAGTAFFVAVAGAGYLGVRGLPFGSLTRPGPAFWPIVVVAAVVLTTVVAVATEESPAHEPIDREGVRRVLVFLASMVVVAWGLRRVGLIPSAVLGLVIATRFAAHRSWLETAIMAVTVPAVAYVVFAEVLNVRLSAFW